jgi:hypothetical protein
VATFVTTELGFRLSHFQYGMSAILSKPFDLVLFTVKALWWFGAWFFCSWAFKGLGRRLAERKRDRWAA